MDNMYKDTYTVPALDEKYFGYEGIAQLLLEQKKLMDALEAENRELRRQIPDMRNPPIMDTLPHRAEPASAGFQGIAQLLLEQKKLMDALEAENRELRRRTPDMRNLPIIDTLPHRMEPVSAGFQGIAQLLLEQKKLMDTLEAENCELRRRTPGSHPYYYEVSASASAGYEGIAQLLLEQKLLMDALEVENRELRQIKGIQSLPSLSTPSSPLVPQNSDQRSHKDEASSTVELAMKIFICYAREDEKLRQQLEKRLKGLRRQGLITIWHDRRISPGAEWEREIDAHLNEAQVILLLVSPDFIDSDYCYGIEMKRALEKHNRKEATVIPIILRYVHWEWTPFGKLQALPKDAKPVCSWPDSDEAFFNVTDGIRIIVEEGARRIREGRDR